MRRIYQVKLGKTNVTPTDLRRWERDGTVYSRLMGESEFVTCNGELRVNFPSWFEVFSVEDQLRIIQGISNLIKTKL